ncbi:MAG: hypothetical protein QXK88_11920 [Desulfurococcaceae archaeon]
MSILATCIAVKNAVLTAGLNMVKIKCEITILGLLRVSPRLARKLILLRKQ